MKVLVPSWPRELPRQFKHRAGLSRRFLVSQAIDGLAMQDARRRLLERESSGGLTQTWSELIFGNRADYTALASFTAEASLLGGVAEQPWLPAGYFDGLKGFGRTISLFASGVVSSTATPSYTFQVRMGTTSGSATLSGSSVGVTAAIVTGSGISNRYWNLRLDLTCYTPGIGTGNCTLSGAGFVFSAGFASPFTYAIEPTTPDTATWTQTLDASLTQYINLSVTSTASSASNTIQCKQLLLVGWN